MREALSAGDHDDGIVIYREASPQEIVRTILYKINTTIVLFGKGGPFTACCTGGYRIQSLFSSLGEEVKGKTIALGGDGRYFNKEAAQIILKLAAGSGLKKVIVGQNGVLATPAASALIRRRSLYGARQCFRKSPSDGAPLMLAPGAVGMAYQP